MCLLEISISLIQALPELFREFGLEDETIPPDTLREVMEQCEDAYFSGDMIPPYNPRDIEYLLKFYAQKACEPQFVPFDEMDRKKIDISLIAKEIVDKDMRMGEKNAYLNELWEDETSLLRAYFGNRHFFNMQLETEIQKLYGNFPTTNGTANVTYEGRSLEDLPLYDWREYAPDLYERIRESVFDRAQEGDRYICAACGKTSPHRGLYQIDHIRPLAKGGKTMAENLQLLCVNCNRRKKDTV